MKVFLSYKLILILFITSLFCETLPLTKRYFHNQDLGYNYTRGTYLIIMSDASLETILRDESTGDFIHFKQTQGYKVKLININDVASSGDIKNKLNQFLQSYLAEDPLLEYVLLIGDVNGNYDIPSYYIDSYNEEEDDVTDYPYTFFNNDPLNPEFFIGRWSIRYEEDLKKIKSRSIFYMKIENGASSYLDNALLVAGNFGGDDIYPVTPIWTSRWLMNELYHYGYNQVDTAFWRKGDQLANSMLSQRWDDGVGIIGYRGWGGTTGWAVPEFRIGGEVDDLKNFMKLPVVMSFVCNTGDFDRENEQNCFAEELISLGSLNNPTGAVAVVGPSDKDTDTRFNNAMYGAMWDALLEERIPELAPALHAGKQAILKEFKDLNAYHGMTFAEFYHHVYGVLGDPSLPVWLGEPKNMTTILEDNTHLLSSFIYTTVSNEFGEPLMDVVGALLVNGELIAKGLSNSYGKLIIDFSDVPDNTNIELYLNKPQYYQKKITLIFQSDDGTEISSNYSIPDPEKEYVYIAIDSESGMLGAPEYNWIEINNAGTNLNLTDDSVIKNVEIGFDFTYYGESFNKLTVCSNGWASFFPCQGNDGSNTECNTVPFFFNTSIGHPTGPNGMLAPFFDDLDDNEGKEPYNVYLWTNSTDSVVVEWDMVANGQHDEDCLLTEPDSCPRHTFQLILVGSSTGNGDILFQYKEVTNWKQVSGDPSELWHVDDHGSTIGIEAPDKNSGTQYLFNELYHPDASGLQNGLSIQFTQICDGPIPLNECDCEGNVDDCFGVCGGSSESDQCGVCGGDNSTCTTISGCTDSDADNYNPNATVDDGSCTLAIQDNLLPQSFTLNSFPNPFNPVVEVSFAVPEFGMISLDIVNIRGQKIASLTNKNYQPGYYTVNWYASTYASGVYFINLMTSYTKLTQKVLLLK